MTLRREHQRGDPDTRGQVGEVLGGQRVQPAEPVGTGYGEDAAVGQVDGPVTGLEPALLPQRVAEVPGLSGVETRLGEDGRGTGCCHTCQATVACPTTW